MRFVRTAPYVEDCNKIVWVLHAQPLRGAHSLCEAVLSYSKQTNLEGLDVINTENEKFNCVMWRRLWKHANQRMVRARIHQKECKSRILRYFFGANAIELSVAVAFNYLTGNAQALITEGTGFLEDMLEKLPLKEFGEKEFLPVSNYAGILDWYARKYARETYDMGKLVDDACREVSPPNCFGGAE